MPDVCRPDQNEEEGCESSNIHRDIKPANLVRSETGQLCLVDFGGVRRALDKGMVATVVGTFGYMAPEQAEGRVKEIGPPADIYALGVILYELLTGRRASQGEETTTQGTPRSVEIDPLVPSQAVLASIEQSPPARRDRLTAEEIGDLVVEQVLY